MHVLEKEFKNLFYKYSHKKEIISFCWKEIEQKYSSEKRHYHNLSHIAELLQFFSEYEEKIIEKDVVLYAIFYHDAIYNVKKKNNEEKSAKLARQRMSQLNIHPGTIQLVYDFIIATKSHETDYNNQDLDYFLDFDMAILGKNWDDYLSYTKQIRKEYSIYPNILFRKGRKEALKSFLQIERIYKTDAFFNKFEERARKNIRKEIKELL